MAATSPIFELGLLNDFEVQKTSLKWLQKHRKRQRSTKPKCHQRKEPLRKFIEQDLEKILEDKQSSKPNKNTNWCVSTFKGEFQTSIVSFLILHD